MTTIIRLNERCLFCNRKTIGQDETGFKCCVKCEYNSDYRKRELSNEERHERSMKIFDELMCSETNPNVKFTCVCDKLKGHKGEHKDDRFPEYKW